MINFARMSEDVKDFVTALGNYVRDAISHSGEPADYNVEAVHIVDARNHIFRPAGRRPTDEAEDIYALRDLCHLDTDIMELVPDRGRLRTVARNYFGGL